MLTSHLLLQRFWHDPRCDPRCVRVWYIDRGAPGDRSVAGGPDIRLEPYYLTVTSEGGEKPVPYHRILLITYDGKPVFVNRRFRTEAGLADSPGEPDREERTDDHAAAGPG